jgi:hypothetical protein
MITLETLHADLMVLRTEMRANIIRLTAKVDSKPSLMAMWIGIFVVVFGMAGVIAATVVTLSSLHLLK